MTNLESLNNTHGSMRCHKTIILKIFNFVYSLNIPKTSNYSSRVIIKGPNFKKSNFSTLFIVIDENTVLTS